MPFKCFSSGIKALIPLCHIAESQWHLSRSHLHLSNAQQSSCTPESSSLARPWAVSVQHITPAMQKGGQQSGEGSQWPAQEHFLQIGNSSQSSSSPIVTSCNPTWQGEQTTECISSLTCSPKSNSTSQKHFDGLPETSVWLKWPTNTKVQHILHSTWLGFGNQVLHLMLWGNHNTGQNKEVGSGRAGEQGLATKFW